MGAALMSCPEIELSEDETKRFAVWLGKVSNLYDGALNPKYVLWVEGALLLGGIYGPRAIAINARWNMEARNPQALSNGTQLNATQSAPNVPPVSIETKRAAKQAAETPARSPVEMFGPLFSGATIPDAV